MKKRKGFTLIELVVVIAVLAIIAAIAVPSLLGHIANGKKKAMFSRAQNALNAAQRVYQKLYYYDAVGASDEWTSIDSRNIWSKKYKVNGKTVYMYDEMVKAADISSDCTYMRFGVAFDSQVKDAYYANNKKHELYTITYFDYSEKGKHVYFYDGQWHTEYGCTKAKIGDSNCVTSPEGDRIADFVMFRDMNNTKDNTYHEIVKKAHTPASIKSDYLLD